MNRRTARPCSSRPSGSGAGSKPTCLRCSSSACTAEVDGAEWRRTVSPILTLPLTFPPSGTSAGAICRSASSSISRTTLWGAAPRAQSSACRFLHERADPLLFGGGQFFQREGDWPHRSLIELRRVLETEGPIPRLEFRRILVE